MSRQEENPVPHEHQFYRTVLKGLLSLDLHAAGTFSYRNRTGFRNLDEVRVRLAQQRGLEEVPQEQSYRLPHEERIRRVAALVRGLAMLTGGAKQTIHYTDVTPAVVLAMVTRGGNNPLQYVIESDAFAQPCVHEGAVREMVRVWGDQLLSPLYVGWVQGFCDPQRQRLLDTLEDVATSVDGVRLPHGYVTGHPREVFDRVTEALAQNAATWLE